MITAVVAHRAADGGGGVDRPVLGYEEAASIAKHALAERKSIRDVVIERGHVDNGTITLETSTASSTWCWRRALRTCA